MFLSKKLSNKRQFRDNCLSDSYNILKGVNEFLPYFSYFLADLSENRYEKYPHNGVG